MKAIILSLFILATLLTTPVFSQEPQSCKPVEEYTKQLTEKHFNLIFSGIVSLKDKIYLVVYSHNEDFIQFAVTKDKMCILASGSGYLIRSNNNT